VYAERLDTPSLSNGLEPVTLKNLSGGQNADRFEGFPTARSSIPLPGPARWTLSAWMVGPGAPLVAAISTNLGLTLEPFVHVVIVTLKLHRGKLSSAGAQSGGNGLVLHSVFLMLCD
jgi:hypothetical protein